jgi:hypothetical protein
MAVLAQEVTSVTCVAKSAIGASEYFLLYGMGSDFEENAYHVWFDVNSGDSEPSGLSSTGIEVDISADTNATQVASRATTAITAQTDFSAISSSEVITITNAVRGTVTDAADGNIGGSFAVSTTTQGTGTKNSNHKHPEDDMAWFIQGDHLAVVTTKGSSSTSVHSKLGDWKGIDESVIEGFLIHYMAEPNAVSAITDTPDIDNTLHSFLVDYVKCKLYMDRAGILSVSDANASMVSMNISSQHERKWKECLIKYGSKKRDKVGGARRIMPPDIR